MKLSPTTALAISFLSLWTELFSVQPTSAQNAQLNPVDQEIIQQVTQCLNSTINQVQQVNIETLEGISMQCVWKVAFLGPDGKIRTDASDRITALIKLTGVTLPKPISQGQATVQVQPIADHQLFSIPIVIGGQTKNFLFDTGASNSMVDNQIAQKLGLSGTKIPNELMNYMAIGNHCTGINAMLYQLPPVNIQTAKVEGINGLGLPNTAIPGQQSGVIGIDFLSGFDVNFNPKTWQLKLLPHAQFMSDAIPLVGKLGIMTTKVKINGEGPFTFMLDTGAEVMVISNNLAKKLALDSPKNETLEVQGFCGNEMGQKTKLAQVNLQKYQATNLDAVILNTEVFNLIGIDGIIGQNFLNHYQQYWQFGETNQLGFPEQGSLSLSPIE